MSEFIARNPEHADEQLIARVREAENRKEDAWREKFLAENLFHDKHLDNTLIDTEDKIRLLALDHEFMEDKKQCENMGQRFALAISDKYLGKIHVVELGRTTDPGKNGEIDGLKGEYLDFLDWMKLNKIVKKEMTRQEGGRQLSVRPTVVPEAAADFAIMIRNRRLIDTVTTHKGKPLSITIVKRMLFSLPKASLFPLVNIDAELKSEAVHQVIEDRFLKNGWGGVEPIRTSYYLGTKYDYES